MNGEKGAIFNIKKYALHDGPGIRTTIFFKGCALNCWWCHNPEGISQSIESSSGVVGSEMSVMELIDEIKKDWIFYEESNGGITISGGEPLLQIDFLLQLVKKIRSVIDTSVTLDTSGFASWETIELIKDEIDLFLYDIKLLDDKLHQKYTGVSNREILSNFEKLDKEGKNLIIRFPVIPGLTDIPSNIDQMCVWMQTLSKTNEIHLLPYHKIAKGKYQKLNLDYKLENLEAPLTTQLEELRIKFEDIGFLVNIGG
ncbi:MAG: glycyl-radical enzyme activating protein [Candidatus Hodarchaeales archaeon]|jgi:pyruvate formate lyase activating enzyme